MRTPLGKIHHGVKFFPLMCQRGSLFISMVRKLTPTTVVQYLVAATFLRRFVCSKQNKFLKVELCLLVVFTLGLVSSSDAWGPDIGHKYIISKGGAILDKVYPDQYKEIDGYITSIQDGAQQEDGTILNGYFGERGPLHFHNPKTSRLAQGLYFPEMESIKGPFSDAIDVAIDKYFGAVAAYKSGDKATAFNLLGHVAHLVTGDLFQPQHVHDDPHASDVIDGDLQVIEDRFDADPAVVGIKNLFPLAPASGPLTAAGVLSFGNTASQMAYAGSRFAGTVLIPADVSIAADAGAIILPGNAIVGVYFMPANPLSTNPDLQYDHFQTVGSIPQFYDYSVRGDFGLALVRNQDWWELPLDEEGSGQQYFYFDQFQNVSVSGQRLDDYYIQQFIPYSLQYTAGLLKSAAKAFDFVAPTIELRKNNAQGEIIPIDGTGFSGENVNIRIKDPAGNDPGGNPAYPTPSGIYKIKLNHGNTSKPIPAVPGAGTVLPVEIPLTGLEEGPYLITAYDGLGNKTLVDFTIDQTAPFVYLPGDEDGINSLQSHEIPLSKGVATIYIDDDPEALCDNAVGVCKAVSGTSRVKLLDASGGVIYNYGPYPQPEIAGDYEFDLDAGHYTLDVFDAAGNETRIPLVVSDFSLEVSTAESHVDIDRNAGTFAGTIHIKASSSAGLAALGLVDSRYTSRYRRPLSGETSLEADLPFEGSIADYYYNPTMLGVGFTDMAGRVVWEPFNLNFAQSLYHNELPTVSSDFTIPAVDLVKDYAPMLPGAIMSVYAPTEAEMGTLPRWWWESRNGFYGIATYPSCPEGSDCHTNITLPLNEHGLQNSGKVQVVVRTWGKEDKSDIIEVSTVADRDIYRAFGGGFSPGTCGNTLGYEDSVTGHGIVCYEEHAPTNTTVALKRYVETSVYVEKVAPTEAVSCFSYAPLDPDNPEGARDPHTCSGIIDNIPTVLMAGPKIYGFTVLMGSPQQAMGAMLPAGHNILSQLPDGILAEFGADTVFTPGILNFSYSSVYNYPGYNNLSGNLAFRLKTDATFDHAKLTIPYNAAGLTPSQENGIKIYKVTDDGEYIALGTTVDTVNKTAQSADMDEFGRFIVAAPRYVNPLTVVGSVYAGGKPELEFTAEGVSIEQSVLDATTPEGEVLLSSAAEKGVLVGNMYKLGPDDLTLDTPGTLKMHFDAVAWQAAGVTSLSLYRASVDGTALYKLSGAILDPVNQEIAIDVQQPAGIYMLIGSTASNVSDTTPPTVTVSFGEPKYVAAEKMYISTLTPVSISGTDFGSGGEPVSGMGNTYYLIDASPFLESPLQYSGPLTLNEGVRTFYYSGSDLAGNMSAGYSVQVYVDGTAPDISLSAGGNPVANAGNAYITEGASITVSAVDATSYGGASGIKDTFFLIDINPDSCENPTFVGAAGTCENPRYSVPFTLSVGTHTVYYMAADNLGNQTAKKSAYITVVPANSGLDLIPPVVKMAINGQELIEGATATISSTDTVILTAVDEGSGLDSIVYSIDTELTTTTAISYTVPFKLSMGSHTVYYSADDNAGNWAPLKQNVVVVGGDSVVSGTISTPDLPAHSTVTVVVTTGSFHDNTPQLFTFEAQGNSLTYDLTLPGGATYYLVAFAGEIGEEGPPAGAPVGVYGNYSPIYITAGANLSGIDLALELDAQPPAATVTSIADNSEISDFTAISGTASDNVGVNKLQAALKDADTQLWWDGRNGQVWVSTTVTPPFDSVDERFQGAPNAVSWNFSVDSSGNGLFNGLSTHLITGHTYKLYLRAIDFTGNVQQAVSTVTFTWTGQQGDFAPSYVQGITGSAQGVSSVNWTWQALSGADGYAVYSNFDVFSASVTAPAFAETGLAPNSYDSICVAAYNSYGAGPRNCVPLPVYTLAAAPGTPEVVSVSTDTFMLKWSNGGNTAGTQYELSGSTDNFESGSSTSAMVGSGMDDVYVTVPGLFPGTTYYVRVRAFNGDFVPSAQSDTLLVRTLAAPPQAPVNLAAVYDPAAEKVSVFWSSAAIGVPAASYRVYKTTELVSDILYTLGSTANLYYDDSTLDSTTYYYSVSAVNSDGVEGPRSTPFRLEVDNVPPGLISDLKVSSYSAASGSAELTWTAPYDNVGLGYYLIKSNVSASWEDAVVVGTAAVAGAIGSAQTYSVPVSSTETLKFFAVRTFDLAGNASTAPAFALLDLEAPVLSVTSPLQPNVTVARPFSMNIAASDNHSISKVDFLVDNALVGSVAESWPTANFNYTWNIGDYTDGNHVLSVKVYDQYGNTDQKQFPVLISYVPPAAPVINQPENNFAVAASTVNVYGAAEPGTYVSIFVNDAFMASVSADSNGNFYAANVPLGGDGAVIVTAQAVDTRGAGPRSAAIAGVVDSGPPGAPAALTAQPGANGKVALTWSLPEGELPASYNIYRSASEGVLIDSAAASSSRLIMSGVKTLEFADVPAADGVYYYAVASVDAANNLSVISNVVSAVADSIAPTAAISLSAETPPLGAGGHIINVAVTEVLSDTPYLVFTPLGGNPVQIVLESSSPYVWVGTLPVTQAMPSGIGAFSFQGLDLTGNAGKNITAGAALELMTEGPVAAIAFEPQAGPELKAGSYPVRLTLTHAAVSAPEFSYSVAAGSHTITLSSTTSAAAWQGVLEVNSGIGEGPHNFSFSSLDALGNTGTLMNGATNFISDTLATGAPVSLHWSNGAAGLVNLTWSTPLGEKPAHYCVYRDAALVTCAVTPKAGDFSGAYSETPSESSHDYYVTALDAAANESAATGAVSAVADNTPPAVPVLSSVVAEASDVALAWAKGDTETPASYRLYRATYTITSTAGLTPWVLVGNSATNTPTKDGVYHYVIAAMDLPGNQSAFSNEMTVSYDAAAPEITVTGVENGAYYNTAAHPAFAAEDLNLASSSALLNNAAFVSGSAVTADGSYTLTVNAADALGHAASKTVNFIIDRSSPAITLNGISTGAVYTSTITPAISAADANLSTITALLNGSPYSIGSVISESGSYTLAVTAVDLAGNTSARTITFTMDLPLGKPQSLSASVQENSVVQLKWEASAEAALYKIYKDGVYLGPVNAAYNSYRDTAYSTSSVHIYSVLAVDSKGREGGNSRAEIPAMSFTVAGFGNYSGVVQALNRGFFDSVRFNVGNNGTQTVQTATVGMVVGENPAVLSSPEAIAAGSSKEMSVVIFTSTSAADNLYANATLTLPKGGDAAISYVTSFPMAVRDPVSPIVEIYPEALVRGAYSHVKLKFNNRGSAPVDIVTAQLSQDKVQASPAAVVELRTLAGLTVARSEITQSSGNVSIAYSGGKQVYFATVEPGSSYLFESIKLAVPAAAESKFNIVGGVYAMAHSLAFSPATVPTAFEASREQSALDNIPYTVSVAPAKQVYDKGEKVVLTGTAIDSVSGYPMANRAVLIDIQNKGYDRFVSTLTASDGSYRLEYSPASGESGIYYVSASHPDVVSRLAQSSFTVVGFELGYSKYSLTLAQNSSISIDIPVINSGESILTDITAAVTNVSGSGVVLVPGVLPTAIEAGNRKSLPITISASPSSSGEAQLNLVVRQSDGFERTMQVFTTVVPAQVIPKLTPSTFEMGMLAGDTRIQSITITNIGFSTWTAVSVSTPTLSWVRVQGSKELGDIAPGANVTITLLIEPPSGLANGSYAQNPLITLKSGNLGDVALNAGLMATSNREGKAAFTVINADKYPNDLHRWIGDATVVLTSLDIFGMNFTVKSDSNGLARLENIPSGRYAYRGEASGFQTVSGITTIEPGLTRDLNIYLPTSMVTYKWSVTPTSLTDKYDITLGMTFRTDVPAPAIVIEPLVVTLAMVGGQTAYTQYTVKNKGLVSVKNFKLKNNDTDPAMKVELPFTEIAEIKPGEMVVVPVKVTLIHASCHGETVSQSGSYECPAGIESNTSAPDFAINAGDCGGGMAGGGILPDFVGWGSSIRAASSSGLVGVASQGSAAASCASASGGTPPGGTGTSSAEPETQAQCNTCGEGADVLTGNYLEPLFDGFSDAAGSGEFVGGGAGGGTGGRGGGGSSSGGGAIPTGFGYRLDYNSINGITSNTSASLKKQSDGSIIVTYPDGTRMLFAPSGNSAIGDGGEPFKAPAGAASHLSAVGIGSGPENYVSVDKNGVVSTFAPQTRFCLNEYSGGGIRPEPVVVGYVLASVAAPNGYTINYNYDDVGSIQTCLETKVHLLDIKDTYGRQLTFAYDANWNRTGVSDNVGRSAAFEYTDNRISAVVDLDGSRTTYQYDAAGRITTINYPNGAHKYISYDGKNRTLSVAEDGDNNKRTFQYLDPTTLTKVTDALGRTTTYSHENWSGRKVLERVTDPKGNSTSYGYDANLNLNSVWDNSNRLVAQMTYDGRSDLLTAADAEGNKTSIAYTTLTTQGYHDYMAPASVTDPKGNKTQMSYDASGNMYQVQDAMGSVYQASYDRLGNVTGIKDPLGHVSLFEYDSLGALVKATDPLGRSSILTRDAFSRVTQVKDANNKLTLFEYDVLDNPNKITDAMGGITQYGYISGTHGLLGAVTDAKGQQTTFIYDLQNRPTETKNPLNETKSYVYDKKGNLTRYTDAKGQIITFEYDEIDRLKVKHLPEGDVNYTYDGVGNLLSVTSPDGAISMSYGILNQVTQVQQTISGQSYAINYTYDVKQNRTGMTTPWGATSYTYDTLNRLTSLTNPDGKTVTFAYDALGRRTRMTYPNGTEASYAYNAASQLTQILHRKLADNTALAFANYAYDQAGNRTQMTDTSGTHNYGYDDLYRLTSVSHPDLPNETFAYDAVGNRTQDAVVANYNYNAANRLLENSSYTYTYDANGNMIEETNKATSEHTTYEYTSENQLKRVELPDSSLVTFKYDPIGRRIEKASSSGTMRYVYDNEDIIATFNGNNTLTQNITHGPGIDEPLIMKRVDTLQNYYYHADFLGSIIAISAENADVVESISYQAYGMPTIKNSMGDIISDSAIGNLYLFNAREYDSEIGFIFLRNRYFSPLIGRFTQEDPIGLDGGLNLYAFAANSPVMYTDPFGFSINDPGWWVLLPVVGPGWDAAYNYEQGNYYSAAFDVGLMALDIWTFGTARTAGVFLLKGGSNTWRATSAWMRAERIGLLKAGEHGHHWLVPQKLYKDKKHLEAIFNQPWNINPMNPKAHMRINNANPVTVLMKGSPEWAKLGAGSAVGRAATSTCP